MQVVRLLDGQVITRGLLIQFEALLNKIPLFVRDGSIISFELANANLLTLIAELEPRIYKVSNIEFSLYDNDERTYYEKGQYTNVSLRS